MLGGLIGFLIGAGLGVATMGKVGAVVGAILGGGIGYLGVVAFRHRSAPRLNTSISVEIRGDPPIYAQATNLSMGGMGLTVNQSFPDGAELDLEFHLRTMDDGDTRARLLVQGTVAWVDAKKEGLYEIGVRFRQLTPEQRQILGRFIDPLID